MGMGKNGFLPGTWMLTFSGMHDVMSGNMRTGMKYRLLDGIEG